MMSAEAARAYHGRQIEVFRNSDADMITAITMNYVEEALGIAQACACSGNAISNLLHG